MNQKQFLYLVLLILVLVAALTLLALIQPPSNPTTTVFTTPKNTISVEQRTMTSDSILDAIPVEPLPEVEAVEPQVTPELSQVTTR